MLHQVPHYPFFTNFNPRGRPWLQAQESTRGVLLPVAARDPSAPPRGPSAEDLAYLKRKGALEVPPKNALDQCVATYFHVFHPFFPVVDKPAFLRRYYATSYEDLAEGKGISLLLVQAIVFTAASVSPRPDSVVAQVADTDRPSARRPSARWALSPADKPKVSYTREHG